MKKLIFIIAIVFTITIPLTYLNSNYINNFFSKTKYYLDNSKNLISNNSKKFVFALLTFGVGWLLW